jgi:O-antigen/teichoic acid export membrane protein
MSVGAGLVISGLASYVFLAVTRKMLGDDDFASLSQLWFLTFILAPGFFLPIEQEVGRALAHRRALGQGGMPVLRRAGVLGAALFGLIATILLIASPWLVSNVFHGSWPLLACLIVAFAGYALAHFVRGMCSGSGSFRSYGMVMGSEGVVRVAAVAVLAVLGVTAVGLYGLLVSVPVFVAVVLAVRGLRFGEGVLVEGPQASWSELTPNLGWLLLGSVLAATLVNAGPITANLLATDDQRDLVSEFSAGVLVARVPLFLFQAVQASLLPKLARLAAAGAYIEFNRGFRKLMTVVVAVGMLGTAAAFLVGPFVLRVFFDDELSRRDLTLLALSSALYMVAVAMAQALIALHGHPRVALGWFVGVATFAGVTAVVSDDLLLRVELGLVAGGAAAAVVFGLVLWARVAHGTPTIDAEALAEVTFDLPVEP